MKQERLYLDAIVCCERHAQELRTLLAFAVGQWQETCKKRKEGKARINMVIMPAGEKEILDHATRTTELVQDTLQGGHRVVAHGDESQAVVESMAKMMPSGETPYPPVTVEHPITGSLTYCPPPYLQNTALVKSQRQLTHLMLSLITGMLACIGVGDRATFGKVLTTLQTCITDITTQGGSDE